MNLHELDSYKLADAVKFHNRLNPRLWDKSEHLLPEVRDKLLEIAADFQEFLGVPDLDVVDVTVSGSNAAYSYTPHSDIDLHLVVKKPEGADEVYQELFNAKKYQYNDMHDIRIHGADVELYVQPADESPVSLGEYSVRDGKWLQVPRRKRAKIDQSVVKHKYEDVKARIESALKDNDSDRIYALIKKIKEMRQAGLDAHGEFGPENLAFKMLRSQGYIERLYKAYADARDRELSLMEKKKRKKAKKKFTYGAYGGWFFPGYNFNAGETGDAGGGDGGGESVREADTGIAQGSSIGDAGAQSTWDGVSPDTDEYLSEDDVNQSVLRDFIRYAASEIGLKKMPRIHIHNDPEWSEQEHSFGRFEPDTQDLHINMWDRHIMDVFRTTAHELAHARQHEIERLGPDAGDTGSDMENEAHAVAGIIMRNWARKHPNMFESSGYIPTAAQANDPRFKMALTKDVRPGQTGREANKMALKTDGQGRPALLMKTANLRESKIKLSTDPNWYGAEVGDYKATGPVVNISASQLVGFEPDDKMNQPKSKANVEKIVAGLKNGDKLPPLLVRKYKNGYQVLDGHHRFWAYKLLGVKSIPVQVVPAEDIEELKEGRMPQPSQGQGKYRDLNKALGPETPPTMPKGTLRVDVSDVYDWYKLGQHISNMKGLGKHDFGAGPPSSIISFGDEETEHKFIKDLEATGLDVTDIDPRDPKQPPGMRKIKTDPTYNVDEDAVESLRREFSLLEDEYIPEVRMSTSNLRQLAAKTGARAGMEFEMIVPDVGGVDLEPEYERDDDQDRRARSFDDIEEFFYDGDYNGRGDVRSLLNELGEAYMEWKMDRTASDWDDEGLDYLRDYIENNDLFDRDEALEIARDEFADANPDIPLDSEEAQRGISARVAELEEQFVQDEFESQGRIYNDAFTEFADEKNQDYEESDFLEEAFPYMSDIERNFDIQWPYYYDINDGQDGEANVDEVADEFSDAIGKPVNASSSYHGARREPGHYVVEPDGSLEGDAPGDTGLEFVSPPLPIDELLSDLSKVKEWAGRRGCYTNDSTGLHINISVPDYSLDKLDYVKLALLMGDEYVLELFGRSGNSYAKAATGKIRTALQKDPDLAPALLDKMRDHMEDLATKAIHSGITDKYTSINTKTGYIEFRSPGGDWLDANFDKIENTLLRFTVALSAAIDPQAYRKEYLKKLYKLLEGSQEKGGVDVVQLFSNYSAGELDKAALIRQVREKQLARDLAKGRTPPGQKFWWKVTNPANTMASIEVVAAGPEEAKAKAVEPGNYPEWARVQNTLRATPLRPYQEPEKKPEQTGNWGIWIRSANRFARAPGQADNSVLRRFPGRDSALQWIEQTRRERPDLRTDIEVREIEPTRQSGTPLSQTDAERRMDLPDQTGDANWEIVDRRTGRRVFVMIANTEYDARRKYADWLSAAGYPIETEDYGFREIARPGSTLDLQRQRANATQDNWSQDFERRMQQPAQQPATGGEFTGQWQVMFNGQELTRVSGIGNNQADANRFARDYVLQQIRSGQLRPVEGAEIEVIPVMA